MDVFIKGKGKTVLTRRHFVAQGGEGSIYAKGKTAFKIYTKREKMIPAAKIRELARLTPDYIINPRDIVLDSQNRPIGYTMTFLPREKSFILCRLFNKAFLDRHGINPRHIVHLIERFREGVSFIHRQGILIVDMNEINFLVDRDFKTIYFLDVDSYQTPGFPATVIMDGIRDRHSRGYSELTDWFSWGILTFQLFVGIHPYRGRHPKLKTLDERMKKNVSVLNPEVSVPKTCRDPGDIPRPYLDWYQALFEDGRRLPPPISIAPAPHVRPTFPIRRVTGGRRFRISELHDFKEDIVDFAFRDGLEVVTTVNGLYLNRRRVAGYRAGGLVGFTPRMNVPLFLWLENGRIGLVNLARGRELEFHMTAEQIMGCGGRFYAKTGENLMEIGFFESGRNNIFPSPVMVGRVLEQATTLQDGLVVQDILGGCYFSLPADSGRCYQLKVDELKGYHIIQAKFDSRACIISVKRGDRYSKFIMRFDDSFSRYDLREIPDANDASINFAVLGHGLAVHIPEEGRVEVFKAGYGEPGLKVIDDPMITSDMKLFSRGTEALCALGPSLRQIAMIQ